MNIRPRRNRKNSAIRAMIEETKLGAENLIYPIFLVDGSNKKTEISSLPNNYRWSIDLLLKEVETCLSLGISTYDIFPAVEEELKDVTASYSYAEENFYLSYSHT
jgi:porphobilinogen synthase